MIKSSTEYTQKKENYRRSSDYINNKSLLGNPLIKIEN
jgi:hypothetical protein